MRTRKLSTYGILTVYRAVLSTLHCHNSERRAALHCYYLRKHPRIHTACCARLHCFNCKIDGDHTGMTCAEYQVRSDTPQCVTVIVTVMVVFLQYCETAGTTLRSCVADACAGSCDSSI
jgi:hypothetical protein